MELPCKHIPKEYLALKINYCRQQLKTLPELRQRRPFFGIITSQSDPDIQCRYKQQNRHG